MNKKWAWSKVQNIFTALFYLKPEDMLGWTERENGYNRQSCFFLLSKMRCLPFKNEDSEMLTCLFFLSNLLSLLLLRSFLCLSLPFLCLLSIFSASSSLESTTTFSQIERKPWGEKLEIEQKISSYKFDWTSANIPCGNKSFTFEVRKQLSFIMLKACIVKSKCLVQLCP